MSHHVSACHSLCSSHYWFSAVKTETIFHQFDRQEVKQGWMRQPVRVGPGRPVCQTHTESPSYWLQGCGGEKAPQGVEEPNTTDELKAEMQFIPERVAVFHAAFMRITSHVSASCHYGQINTNCLFISGTQILLLNASASCPNAAVFNVPFSRSHPQERSLSSFTEKMTLIIVSEPNGEIFISFQALTSCAMT